MVTNSSQRSVRLAWFGPLPWMFATAGAQQKGGALTPNRIAFPFAMAALALAASLGLASRCAEQPDRRPNFIVIFTDDQGYGDLSCYGSAQIRTPRIDGMAREGMKFTDFYVAASVCTPSRAALLTGSYPCRSGLTGVLMPKSKEGLKPGTMTIAELLKSCGYATACIGKWHLGHRPEHMPNRHGFDCFFGLPYSNDMIPPRFPPLPLMRNETQLEVNPDQDTLTRRYTEEAMAFIRENREKPFFLYLPHSMPHRPCHASADFCKRFSEEEMSRIQGDDKDARDFLYPAAVEEIDWSVGRLLDVLGELGLAQNTLVVFTSDNGPKIGSAGPLRGGKGSILEGGHRVPCVMRWPGVVPPGVICRELVTAMDLYPTLARLAGGELPAGRIIDGKDITGLLRGENGAKSPHEAFFYMEGSKVGAVRSGRWKFHLENGALYDLEEDLAERNDVSGTHADVVERLKSIAKSGTPQSSHTP